MRIEFGFKNKAFTEIFQFSLVNAHWERGVSESQRRPAISGNPEP